MIIGLATATALIWITSWTFTLGLVPQILIECVLISTTAVTALMVWNNDSLKRIGGFKSLESVGDDLVTWDNLELCTSLAEALRDQLLDAGGIGGI